MNEVHAFNSFWRFASWWSLWAEGLGFGGLGFGGLGFRGLGFRGLGVLGVYGFRV